MTLPFEEAQVRLTRAAALLPRSTFDGARNVSLTLGDSGNVLAVFEPGCLVENGFFERGLFDGKSWEFWGRTFEMIERGEPVREIETVA